MWRPSVAGRRALGLASRHRAALASKGVVESQTPYWIAIVPAAAAVVALIVVPLGYAFALSLRNYNLLYGFDSPAGLNNYVNALTNDPVFWASLLRTLVYMVVVITLDFVLGFAQAFLLYQLRPRAAAVFRSVFLLPILVIPAASAMFWRLTMWGTPNSEFLRVFGLNNILPPPLGSVTLAFPAIIITVWWAWSPFVFLLIHGGLEGLDQSVIEAAKVDGASYGMIIRKIILPLLKPVIFVALSFKAVDSFLSFPFIWIMTQGGPGDATHLLSTFVYQQAFQQQDYGYGSALAIVMLAISGSLSIVAVSVWQKYGAEEWL